MRSASPVSYTHLDVYKRQDWDPVALDKFYMQMQTTANYLTQQFAAMNKSSK